eukprot:CAMPEP_0206464104 /NCGR_PEP_ID=MMETSP0324_2-20121206/27015_1 /ASSEMBLY_ACC=CAM_ASM_000836 /TAXON_ID=2866 /ORGANISM="Crypthecodinium cohnii, Strain Seligo" /LENGTH=48 /DNA_ID= /DNA_START= /DNA_END= /DNA_ORIENTATION=
MARAAVLLQSMAPWPKHASMPAHLRKVSQAGIRLSDLSVPEASRLSME